MNKKRNSASKHNIITCLECGALSRVTEAQKDATLSCPSCHAILEHRKSNSVSRTWALVISGFILYIPANLFPIMSVDMLGNAQTDTIMTGVVELFSSGMWAIGLLVFCASITVPLMKLIGLSWLLLSLQFGWGSRKKDRTRMYRIIEFIGRWSMLDVFLLSILVAVVNLGNVATIYPEIGMVFFASVVVLTMFAANSFDPRLIWDRAESN